jgi:(p)ppGpp synthase/HD superfamily hydrolase
MSYWINKAQAFATFAHGSIRQRRKYTDEPYINHPAAVVALLREVGETDEAMLCAAWLHDTVEDTGTTIELVKKNFGPAIARIVWHLTDEPIEGNRAARKAASLHKLATGDCRVRNIKVADLIDNTKTIVAHDPKFARVYMREKQAALAVLSYANPDLMARAQRQIDDYVAGLVDAAWQRLTADYPKGDGRGLLGARP